MAAGAVELLFECVFDGSLSIKDKDKERRPYHKYCSCALHRRQSSICFSHRRLSLPKKKTCNGLALSDSAARFLTPSSCPAPALPIQRCTKDKAGDQQ